MDSQSWGSSVSSEGVSFSGLLVFFLAFYHLLTMTDVGAVREPPLRKLGMIINKPGSHARRISVRMGATAFKWGRTLLALKKYYQYWGNS